MNNVVNLNRFRKQKRRAEAEQTAEENRTKFGRSKSEKKINAATKKKRNDRLDGHIIDDDGRD